MIITIRVIPRAKQNFIKIDGDVFRVYTVAVPADGAANSAVIKLLAAHFKTAKSNVRIIRGDTSRDKIVEIAD